jgi:hypothetical protein
MYTSIEEITVVGEKRGFFSTLLLKELNEDTPNPFSPFGIMVFELMALQLIHTTRLQHLIFIHVCYHT